MRLALSNVNEFVISPGILEKTLVSLREYGARRLECLVLWLGNVEESRALVTGVLVPQQESISSEDGVGYFVNTQTLFLLNKALNETGVKLLAQVHSHPTEAYHSDADDQFAIVTAEGGLSLVVPDFGRVAPDLSLWAVYRLTDGFWRELNESEVRRLFSVQKVL